MLSQRQNLAAKRWLLVQLLALGRLGRLLTTPAVLSANWPAQLSPAAVQLAVHARLGGREQAEARQRLFNRARSWR
jgi:hypothetical protein